MAELRHGVGWAALLGTLGALMIAGLARLPRFDADPSGMDGWEPTLAEVVRNLGVAPLADGDERIRTFCEMLTKRYRTRLLAVRVIVHPPNVIELRCGANMTRWMMARVTVQVERDAVRVFGRPFRVDVYETYVAAPRRKVAELIPAQPGRRAKLSFDPQQWVGPAE